MSTSNNRIEEYIEYYNYRKRLDQNTKNLSNGATTPERKPVSIYPYQACRSLLFTVFYFIIKLLLKNE